MLARDTLHQGQKDSTTLTKQVDLLALQVAEARRQVDEAHRPVLVPLADNRTLTVPLDEPHQTHAKPTLRGKNFLWVPVENVGAGPALRIEPYLAADPSFPVGLPTEPTPPNVRPNGHRSAGVGDNQILPLGFESYEWPRIPSFELTVLYDDIGGKRWVTTARWASEYQRYTVMDVREARTDDEGGRPFLSS